MARHLLVLGLVLGFLPLPDKPTLTVQTYREAGKDGWFTATLTPPKVEDADLLPLDVTLVVDTSGSMRGTRLTQMKRVATYLAGRYRPTDRINLIRFASTVEGFAAEPVAKPDLGAFIDKLEAEGGCAIGTAVERAMAAPAAPGRVSHVVLVTDGSPTMGVTEPDVIYRYARAGAAKGARLFVFGIGNEVDPEFLEGLALAGHGRAAVIEDEGDSKEVFPRLTAFLDRIAEPVISDIEFTVAGLDTHEIRPTVLPDLYRGEQVLVAGRYRGGGEKSVTFTGWFRGRRESWSVLTPFRTEPGGSPLVKDRAPPRPGEKLWTAPAWLTRTTAVRIRRGAPKSERNRQTRPPKSVSAIDLGLDWLVGAQSPSGGYRSDMEGRVGQEVGVTGLATLAFLSNGETPFSGPHQVTVLNAMKWILSKQDGGGSFGARTPPSPRMSQSASYGHAIATLAVVEAYGMTGSVYLERSAQDGLDFIAKMQNPYLAWRYGVRPQDNDTSVSTWMLMALTSGRESGLKVSTDCFDGARAWYEKITEPEYGRAGYTARGTGPSRASDRIDLFPPDRTESLTAMALFGRILCGEDPEKSEIIPKSSELLMKVLPTWDQSSGIIDMIYWHFGTLAMKQVGGPQAKKWNDAVEAAILQHQHEAGPVRGSWDPIGAWGRHGGRVYSTAINVLTLETYRRYPRLTRR